MLSTEPYYYNESNFLIQKNAVEANIAILQQAIDAYAEIDGVTPILNSELGELFNAPLEFIGRKIIESNGEAFGGFVIKASKVFEVFEKPAGVDSFLQAVKQANSQFKKTTRIDNQDKSIELFYYELNEDNEIAVTEAAINSIRRGHSLFFENEKQQSAFAILNSIADKYNELRALFGGYVEYDKVFQQAFNSQGYGSHLYNKDLNLDPRFISSIR